jgi:polysaccharide deacetylase family protein (PEP-CTERM system associated)
MQNILTVDVEEIFHAEYAKNLRNGESIFRTSHNIPMILNLLNSYGVKATFFVVGEIAEKYPWILREIADRGNEVAFHSYDHRPLWEKTPSQLEREINRFNVLLTSVTGEKCESFRAPSFSLDNKTRWAVEVLEKAGISYDSSTFPVWTPLYGLPSAPLDPYKPSKEDLTKKDENGKLWEFPLATYQFLRLRIPAAGGLYLRFATSFVEKAIKKMNKGELPAVVYIHNWELDPQTPKLKLGPYASFITYYNIDKTADKLRHLLSNFSFTSLRDYVETEGFA